MLDGYGLEKRLVRIIAMIIILYWRITDFTQYRHNGGGEPPSASGNTHAVGQSVAGHAPGVVRSNWRE